MEISEVFSFRNITLGQYIPGETIIHRLDPRAKLGAMLMIIIGLFLINNLWGYLCVAGLLLLVIMLARIPLSRIIRGLKPVLFIMLFTFVLHLFFSEGTALWHLGPLTVTKEGILRGTEMVARLILLVISASLLTLTTSPLALTDGLEMLLAPGQRIGLPAHELAMMMTIALRFIPTLMEETEKIMKAQMARGASFTEGNLVRRAKSLLPVLVPLFVSAFRRAEDLAVAMEARGYVGGEGRTRFKQLEFKWADWIALGLTLGTLGIVVIIW
ncbi:MAG: energy-coupling factor transporter transmembrane protein EcfT [Limnochordia bacterium]|nr:energy-coupling factor transporter transmembrane protein EcfT [Limnochordia bacterium]MDD4517478.1 energy-coupling factor transporter transmembrane component T [Limnochordia bacterium]